MLAVDSCWCLQMYVQSSVKAACSLNAIGSLSAHTQYLVILRAFGGRSPARRAAQAMPRLHRGLQPSTLCTLSIVMHHRCPAVTPVCSMGVGVGALHATPGSPFWAVFCFALPVMLFFLHQSINASIATPTQLQVVQVILIFVHTLFYKLCCSSHRFPARIYTQVMLPD